MLAASVLGLGSLSALVFAPLTFVVKARLDPRLTYEGHPVKRYGYSLLHTETFLSHADAYSTKRLRGRCFVDFLKGAENVRAYGWQLDVRGRADRTKIELRLR